MRGSGGHISERVGTDGKRRHMVKIEVDRDRATGRRRQQSAGTFRTKRDAQEALATAIADGPTTATAKGTWRHCRRVVAVEGGLVGGLSA